MSSPKHKLHFATSIIQAIKEIKAFIFPVLIVLVANGFKININSVESAMELIPVIVIIGIFIFTIIRGITKWLTFTYWVEDQELKTEYGFLFKKKRFVPIERIQNLNYNEGIIHRLFNVVQISIETAGGATATADVELTAITKRAANEIEQLINQHRKQELHEEQIGQENNIIYKIKNSKLLLLASTSNSVGVVLAGIAALFSQLVEFIPFEKISSQFSFLLQYGFVLVMFIIALAIFIAWIISVAMTYLSYYNFTLKYDDDQLEITRGLIEKKKISIPVQKIQAIKIVENPIRQLFGYATVTIENAGSSMTSSKEKKVEQIPFIEKNQIQSILQNIQPEINLNIEDGDFSPLKARPLFYRKFVWVIVIGTVLGTAFILKYLLFLLLLIPLFVYLGVIQHRNAWFKIDGDQLAVQYRIISKVLYLAKHNKIQAFEITQTIFQKRLQIYSGKVFVLGNMGGVKIKMYHHSKEALSKLYQFINKRDV